MVKKGERKVEAEEEEEVVSVTPRRGGRSRKSAVPVDPESEGKVDVKLTPRAGRRRAACVEVETTATGSVTPVETESGTPRKSRRLNDKRSGLQEIPPEEDLKSPLKTPKNTATKKISRKYVAKTPTKTPLKLPASPFKSPEKITNGEWRFNSLGVPKCPLPCRESQFEEIWTFMHENITHKHSRCMYVSGVPGTGKTVIVQSVVDTLSRYANERKDHLKFQYVYINGLSLGAPDKIWKRFYCGLKEEKIKLTPQMALKKLGLYFEASGRLPIVLVIDELDQILDKSQSILYQLLEWSGHHSTMFSLIAIFNTMSLPESGLAMRNVSRIGFIRSIFPPYTHDQLKTIVMNSLTATKNEKIKDDAIELLSRKVAAVSGDARRALEIAKRAVEIVETGQLSGLKAVNAAFKEIFSSPKVETIKDCTALEQLFLRTISAELQSTGGEETTLASIYRNLCTAAMFEGMNWTVDQVVNAAMRLCLMKLIIAENESTSIHKRLSLNVPVEDINFALGMRLAEEDS